MNKAQIEKPQSTPPIEKPSLADGQAKALLCVQAALDRKAENVRILDLSSVGSFTDFFVVCSGRSDRQAQAISDSIRDFMKTRNLPLPTVEGQSEGRWVLMDLGDVIVHIFLDELRDYYDIEGLWSDARRVPIPAELLGPGASSWQG